MDGFLTPKPVLIQAMPMMAHRIFLFGGILFAVLDTTNFYIALYDHGTRQLSFPYFVDEQTRALIPNHWEKG